MRGPAEAYPFLTYPDPLRFAVAVLFVGIGFGIDYLGGALVDDGGQFILLGTAVMAVAWLAGTGPALVATVLAASLGAVRLPGTAESAADVHLALFVFHALLVTGIVAELRRARRDAEARAHEAHDAREQGESANRLKDEFLATISHELRTPLNAVLGWVHLLGTGRLDPESSARGLASIERNIRLQAQLTADLLDVSKALTGKLQINPRAAALDEAMLEAVAAVKPAARAKDVRIQVKQPDAHVMVHGDPGRLRQIAWQLLANAIKFSPRGGAVEIAVDVFGQDARLVVRDKGPGIDPEFLPRVFERFTQADPSPTRTAGGLGVGLALVRELVELQGGEVQARNREDDSGAIFLVRFPLRGVQRRDRQLVPTRAPSVDTNGLFLDGVRVLVLDQEPEGRDLLRAVLQDRGADVQTAGSVEEPLQSLEGWRPDVLVSDTLSPDHDSYALIGKVPTLEAERGGRIPAVALTTLSRTDDRLRDLIGGTQRDLPKPVEPAVLTSEIARLTGRERRRERR
jgi:signal transduction histidine kinase/CheY-like chemotaxis protein